MKDDVNFGKVHHPCMLSTTHTELMVFCTVYPYEMTVEYGQYGTQQELILQMPNTCRVVSQKTVSSAHLDDLYQNRQQRAVHCSSLPSVVSSVRVQRHRSCLASLLLA